jgi:dihydrofolate reductase
MPKGEGGAPDEFIDRMNAIPKYVASTTFRETTWNATVIPGDVASFVAELKQQPGGNIVKYGNGPLDATLVAHGLIDEFHLLVTRLPPGAADICSKILTALRRSGAEAPRCDAVRERRRAACL